MSRYVRGTRGTSVWGPSFLAHGFWLGGALAPFDSPASVSGFTIGYRGDFTLTGPSSGTFMMQYSCTVQRQQTGYVIFQPLVNGRPVPSFESGAPSAVVLPPQSFAFSQTGQSFQTANINGSCPFRMNSGDTVTLECFSSAMPPNQPNILGMYPANTPGPGNVSFANFEIVEI
jgi:hypothetical protein